MGSESLVWNPTPMAQLPNPFFHKFACMCRCQYQFIADVKSQGAALSVEGILISPPRDVNKESAL